MSRSLRVQQPPLTSLGELVPLTNWSLIELDIGVICVCMPALRILITRVVPDLIKTSRERDSLGGSHPWLELANRHNQHSFQRTGDAVCVGGPAEPASNPESTTCGKKVLGEEHPGTLTSIANLVSTYRNQGRWKEAELLEVQVMEMKKRAVGDEHPDTLRIMGNLTTASRNESRWEEAEELEGQMMETNSRVAGRSIPTRCGALDTPSNGSETEGDDASGRSHPDDRDRRGRGGGGGGGSGGPRASAAFLYRAPRGYPDASTGGDSSGGDSGSSHPVITLLVQPSQVQRANKLTSCRLLSSRSRR